MIIMIDYQNQNRCIYLFILSQVIFIIIVISMYKQSKTPLGINESCHCHNSSTKNYTFLYVMIMSRYDNVNGRAAIRETWAGQHGYPTDEVVIKFSIGIGGLHQNFVRELRSEQERFDDLLLLEFNDTYDNLTLKLLNSLTAAHKTYDFAYFYKGDDDTFVMLNQIYKELHDVKNKRNNYYWGYFLINITPHVKGKWKETNWYLSDRYFPYARGSGYVISGDLARHIAVNADGLQMYRSEDVSLASWIAKFDVERRNDNRFVVGTPSSPCVNGYLVYHGITVDNMKKMHQKLLKTKKPC